MIFWLGCPRPPSVYYFIPGAAAELLTTEPAAAIGVAGK